MGAICGTSETIILGRSDVTARVVLRNGTKWNAEENFHGNSRLHCVVIGQNLVVFTVLTRFDLRQRHVATPRRRVVTPFYDSSEIEVSLRKFPSRAPLGQLERARPEWVMVRNRRTATVLFHINLRDTIALPRFAKTTDKTRQPDPSPPRQASCEGTSVTYCSDFGITLVDLITRA